MDPLSLEKPARRRFSTEPGLLCARLGPLPIAAALSGVAWQAELRAPAKFVALCGVEAEIQAEIPLVAERPLCEKLADAALDQALLWPEIAGDPHEPDLSHNPGSSLNPNLATFSDDEIDSALSQTSWGFRQQDTGSYQIDAAPAPGHAMRVTLSRREGCLRASTTTSVRAGSVEVLRALATFALESNRRLRLARISVADGNEQADIVWDAVLPAPLPVAGALASIVDAVVYAQMFTRRSLNVLTDPRIAAAYLRDRPPSVAALEGDGRTRSPKQIRHSRVAGATAARSPVRHSITVEQPQ